jgi:hypothetical protein
MPRGALFGCSHPETQRLTQVHKTEFDAIYNAFFDQTQLYAEGIRLKGTKYVAVSANPRSGSRILSRAPLHAASRALAATCRAMSRAHRV